MPRKKIRIGNCSNGCNKEIHARNVCKNCYRKIHYQEHEKARRYPNGVLRPRESEVGTLKLSKDGYVYIKVEKGSGKGIGDRDWMKHHRYVMERHLGRDLLEFENVHHINGNRSDNRIENLELWVTKQPKGQRPSDLIEYAKWILKTYSNEQETIS